MFWWTPGWSTPSLCSQLVSVNIPFHTGGRSRSQARRMRSCMASHMPHSELIRVLLWTEMQDKVWRPFQGSRANARMRGELESIHLHRNSQWWNVSLSKDSNPSGSPTGTHMLGDNFRLISAFHHVWGMVSLVIHWWLFCKLLGGPLLSWGVGSIGSRRRKISGSLLWWHAHYHTWLFCASSCGTWVLLPWQALFPLKHLSWALNLSSLFLH